MMAAMAPHTPPTSDLLARISVDPAVCHGQACVAGTRVLVTVVLDNLAAGRTADEIVSDYPPLRLDDVSACIVYAAELAHSAPSPCPRGSGGRPRPDSWWARTCPPWSLTRCGELATTP